MKNQFVAVIKKPLVLMGISLFGLLSCSEPSETTVFADEYTNLTPWGDPDITGKWSYASLTPLQRPQRLGEKEFYTPEEAAETLALPVYPELARAVSAPFIVAPEYGTRCSTTVVWRETGKARFAERRFDAAGRPSGESAFNLQF